MAILHNDIENVYDLISNGARVDKTHVPPYFTPLHAACGVHGQAGIVRLLIDSNASVYVTNSKSETPLHKAAGNQNVNVVVQLLEANADINAVCTDGDTPLMSSIQLKNHINLFHGMNSCETIWELIIHNADVNLCNWEQSTPLHEAVKLNMIDVVTILLGMGVAIDALDAKNRTPLNCAIKEQHTNIAVLLLEWHADANQCIRKSVNTIPDPGVLGNQEIVEADSTPLHQVALFANFQVLRPLFEHGALIDALDEHSRTPVELAVACKRHQGYECIPSYLYREIYLRQETKTNSE